MKRTMLSLVAGAALLIGSSANAALVTHTASASLQIVIQNIGSITATGQGVVTVDTATGGIAVPSLLVSLPATLNFPVTTTTAVVSVIAGAGIDNFAGSFFPGNATANTPAEICAASARPNGCILGGNVNGPMALSGTVSVRLPGNVVLPIPLQAALIGVGGSTMVPNSANGFLFENGLWTSGTAKISFVSSVTNLLTSGGVPIFVAAQSVMTTQTTNATLLATGSNNVGLTSGSGQITLVTPTYVNALGNQLPIFATFAIHIIPEPGTLVLLGSGIVGLALYGRNRKRKG